MALDTKWKRYKYSKFNKILCFALACVFLVIAFSQISTIVFKIWYEADTDKNGSFISSDFFFTTLNRDLSEITQSLRYETERKEANAYYENAVEDAFKAYKREEKKALVSKDTINELVKQALEESGNPDTYVDVDLINNVFDMHIYKGNDGNYYDLDFDTHTLEAADIQSNHINFGKTDTNAKEMIKEFLLSNAYSGNYYDSPYIPDFKNILYLYEINGDESFSEIGDKNQFIKKVKSGEGVSFYIENGKLYKSKALEESGMKTSDAKYYAGIYNFDTNEAKAGDIRTDSKLYVLINTAFSADDEYAFLNAFYNDYLRVSFTQAITYAFISVLAFLMFAVFSVRLTGHDQNGGISVSALDKLPTDLRFVFDTACCIGLGFALIGGLWSLIDQAVYNYNYAQQFFDTPDTVFKLLKAAAAVCVCGIYFFVTDFVFSFARNIKAGRSVLKNTVIYAIIKLFYKYVILTIKKIADKFIYIVVSLFKKPKKLSKKVIVTAVAYTLVNVLALSATLFFILAETIWPCLLIVLALMVFDIYVVYKAVYFLKSLDAIIDAGQRRETPELDTQALPESLKTLVQSLESTNADLQTAVSKAVRDERTKAELITNVSHDLKTPLTSVINYIDLLKKCDIQDETECKYIGIIDEKSKKLKRLIEDLIEASKVSSGNITLNKTVINLNELASQAIVEEAEGFEKNGLKIVFEESKKKYTVFADGSKIYRVFENLLTNAKKYSAPGTRVYARLYEDGDFGYFELKNISKEQLNISVDELTERFVRGDKSRSQDGNGLGLSIAKELCILNGGELILAIDGDLFKATVKLPRNEYVN